MKHQVWTVLLCVSFSLYAESVIADKLDRIGRFSYEDSFDENLVETVLKNSSPVVKRNVKRLLYPDAGQQEMQRLLLLGGESNASTTAIAKAMAVRCGYEYYVIDASVLLQAYREGRQMLLDEVRPIIKQGKPIAIIITELPEMADYSGLLASTLWLLIDQCAQYQDVFVIATSAFKKEQLSQEIKDHFDGDIINVALNKSMRNSFEDEVMKRMSWLERNKGACIVVAGLACFVLGVAHLYAQILFADAQVEQDNKQMLLQDKMVLLYEQLLGAQKEERDIQNQMLLFAKEGREIQDKQYEKQIEQHAMQKEQYCMQLNQYITHLIQLGTNLRMDHIHESHYKGYFDSLPIERKQAINQYNTEIKQIEERIRKRLSELT